MPDKRIALFPSGVLTPDSILPIVTDGITSQIRFLDVLNLCKTFDIHLTGGTYNPTLGISSFVLSNGVSFDVAGYFELGYIPENISNKQDNMVIDGTGIKYPTVNAVNELTNNFSLAILNTGFIDSTDTFVMSRIDDEHLGISATSKGILFKSLLETPPFAPSSAILQIPETVIPLSGISFSGDGIYIRFIGFDDTSQFVYSPTNFRNYSNIAQLGVLILKVSGGTVSFEDATRTVINMPSICGYSNLETTILGLQSNVTVRPNSGTMMVNNTNGTLRGMSVNWHGAKNDERPIASSTATSFTHLSYANALTTTPPPFVSAVTTDQYWNGSALVNLSTTGSATVQRWIVTINGTLALQYGEQEYANLDTAKNNISTATFIDVIPFDTYAEIARMAAISGTTDLGNSLQAVFVVSAGIGNVGSTNTLFWGDITGSLSAQTDLFNVFQTQVGNAFVNLGTATTTSINFNLNTKRNYNITLTGSSAYTFNFTSGPDGTESNIVINMPLPVNSTVTMPANVKWHNNSVTAINNLDTLTDNTFTSNINVGIANVIIQQPDNKLIVGGSFTFFNGFSNVTRIIRTNTDGSIDPNFYVGTGFNNTVSAMTLQSDNKILIGGDFTTYYGLSNNYMLRLNTDGIPDLTFNIGTGFNNSVTSLAIQTGDTKILVGGNFTQFSGVQQNRLIRLNSGGTIDNTFSVGTGFDALVKTITIQPNNKILVGGDFIRYNPIFVNRIIKLNLDGSVDNTFNAGAGLSVTVYGFAQQSGDSKVIVFGPIFTYSGITVGRIFRTNLNGSLDNTFNVGTGFNNTVYGVNFHPNDKIVVAGQFTQYSGGTAANRIIRLNLDGSIDNSFNVGSGPNNYIFKSTLQSDNKILCVGAFTTFTGSTANHILRLNVDGSLDTSFSSGVGFNNNLSVYGITVQLDQQILVCGDFITYSGISINRLIRLNPDGNIDSTFNIGTGFNYVVRFVLQQPDSKLLVCGEFTQYSGITANRLIRLNLDGSVDNTFNIGSGFNGGFVNSLTLQLDGKIVVGGDFTTFTGVTANKIVRLNTDGSQDLTFNVGGGFNNNVLTSLLDLSGNSLYIGGGFTTYSGISTNRIIRLNSDGSYDNTLNIGTGFNSSVNTMVVQTGDSKILVGGDFIQYSGFNINRMIRLNSDGTRDTSFNIGAGFNGVVRIIRQHLPLNRIFVGGDFTAYSNLFQQNFIRMYPDGSPDFSFSIGIGGQIYTILQQQQDTKIVIGGNTYIRRFSATTENNIFLKLKQEGSNIFIK